jgi:hypothetical protein
MPARLRFLLNRLKFNSHARDKCPLKVRLYPARWSPAMYLEIAL